MSNLEEIKQDLVSEIQERVEDRIMEQNNADLLIKLINNAESISEAISIAELGTSYQRTGFHFDVKMEKFGNAIKYLKKNNVLSFEQGGTKNSLIIGDNYDALQNLLISHKEKVDVIYIDPPYGKDSMGVFAETNYNNAITRDNLLSQLYPRLKLARKLLSERGVLFCSIDERNQAYLKCMLDDIFKEKNYLGTLIVQTATDNNATQITIEHEYMIAFAKNKEVQPKWEIESEAAQRLNRKYESLKITCDSLEEVQANLQKWIRENKNLLPEVEHYKYVDEKGVFSASSNSSNPHPGGYNYEIYHPTTKKACPKPANGWRWPESTFLAYAENGEVYWGKDETTQPHIKLRLNSKKQKLKSVINADSRSSTKELSNIIGSNKFSNPKTPAVLKMIFKYCSYENSTILDFYAGSGTTGQAVLELNKEDGGNRQFILCTNNEITEINPHGIAYDVTAERLKRIMTGKTYDGTSEFSWAKDNEPLGNSLDVYDIATVANFENVDNKTPFDVIDETNYELPRFENIQDKIEWICDNFDNAQKLVEGE